MDTGKGTFIEISEHKARQIGKSVKEPVGVFRVGQTLEINGSRFKVKTLRKKDMVLRLLPR